MSDSKTLPLSGIRVVEFSHMVMGPSAGLVLADLGADVIKIEPPKGDKTRDLKGSGAGYFAMYNRNKRSMDLDMKSAWGKEVVERLVARADIVIENFRPGALEKLGYGYDALAAINPALIYCSARGFLSGPYEQRTALDEVTQMMGGLAYMTGPPGQPLRAGASVIDVMGGLFGVIGILSALEERHRTGRGQQVSSSLYESTAFLVGQHMAQYVATGSPAAPMPARVSAWSIYDLFDTQSGEKLFVGVVSDSQWRVFCREFELTQYIDHPEYTTNAQRVTHRAELIPVVQTVFNGFSNEQLIKKLDLCGLPYAPIAKPEDLFEDPHLTQSQGLVPLKFPNGKTAGLPALPLEMSGQRLGLRYPLPEVGEHTQEILRELELDDPAVKANFSA